MLNVSVQETGHALDGAAAKYTDGVETTEGRNCMLEVTNIASRKTSRHDQPLMLAKRHVKRLTRRNVTQEKGVGVH